MYYIGVRDGKMGKNRKRRQRLITASWFSFPQYTWPLSRCIQNLKTGSHSSQISVTEILLGREKKWTNKGNGKQETADSLSHNTTSHTLFFTKFQNPKCNSS